MLLVLRLAQAGHRYGGNVFCAGQCAKLIQQLKTIYARHGNIREHNIDIAFLRSSQCFLAARRRKDNCPDIPQVIPKHVGCVLIIVDHEHDQLLQRSGVGLARPNNS